MPARSRRLDALFAMISALAALLALVIVAPVSAAEPAASTSPAAAASPAAPSTVVPPLKCRIGKPSYCFKYGGFRCRKQNSVPNAEATCAAWTEACLDCHRDIPECFGSVRPLAGSAKCAECEQQWHDCMHRIDAKHWPDRLKPTPDD